MGSRFVLAQISDTHVRADDGGVAARQLKKALAQAREYEADVILLTDDRALMRAAFPEHRYWPREGHLSFVIEDYPVRVVCVDQIVPGETHGMLTEVQAEWLRQTLADEPEKPTIVALHHPPFKTHDLLFDKIGLLDGELFASVIAEHRQVERVICGHHHRVSFGQSAHAPVIVAPSSSWTYGLALNDGQPVAPITSEEPGWMLHVWTETGFASHYMGL